MLDTNQMSYRLGICYVCNYSNIQRFAWLLVSKSDCGKCPLYLLVLQTINAFWIFFYFIVTKLIEQLYMNILYVCNILCILSHVGYNKSTIRRISIITIYWYSSSQWLSLLHPMLFDLKSFTLNLQESFF